MACSAASKSAAKGRGGKVRRFVPQRESNSRSPANSAGRESRGAAWITAIRRAKYDGGSTLHALGAKAAFDQAPSCAGPPLSIDQIASSLIARK
jgi:hypothetical protein